MKPTITCARRLQFCAGHRVYGHESKCSHLHGHNYVVLIEAQTAVGLDTIGRVVDFSVLKEFYGGWIDRNWDHGFLLWDKDTEAIAAMNACKGVGGCAQKLYLMPHNPTAENIAEYMRREVGAACVGNRELLRRLAVNCRLQLVSHDTNVRTRMSQF